MAQAPKTKDEVILKQRLLLFEEFGGSTGSTRAGTDVPKVKWILDKELKDGRRLARCFMIELVNALIVYLRQRSLLYGPMGFRKIA